MGVYRRTSNTWHTPAEEERSYARMGASQVRDHGSGPGFVAARRLRGKRASLSVQRVPVTCTTLMEPPVLRLSYSIGRLLCVAAHRRASLTHGCLTDKQVTS